jgi:ATP/ADP translocase
VPGDNDGSAHGNAADSTPAALASHHKSKRKIAALGVLFFCSTFIYTILQNLKDSIIVTRSGAEVLPFLEAYGVLPVSVGFFMLYRKLVRAWMRVLVVTAKVLAVRQQGARAVTPRTHGSKEHGTTELTPA